MVFNIARVSLILLALPGVGLAESMTLPSRVTAVTLYPDMAEVSREIRFTATAAGTVDLVVPDLPAGALSVGMRFATDVPAVLDSFALRTDRVPALLAEEPAEVTAARAALAAAEAELRKALQDRDAILARAQAAEGQLAFLSALKLDGGALSPQALVDLTATVGQQILAARQAGLSAQAEADALSPGIDAATKRRDAAQAALDVVLQDPADLAALTLSLTLAKPGPVVLTVTHFIGDASWRPAYDLRLDDRASPPVLTVDRGAFLSQSTGEDWADVDVTLSTARPGERAESSLLYPLLSSIGDPLDRSFDSAAMAEAAPMVAEAAPEEKVAVADTSGIAVTYHLDQPVSVATGPQELRLALDSLTFAPEVVAQAVPLRDPVAFVLARWVNSSPEILLPGDAMLFRDGMLVGSTVLGKIAAGDRAETGFGALDGITLTRRIPDASQGERGVFTSSTERRETAVIEVKNLTDRDWPLRVLDQVPYSEQDDLKIDWSAEPAPGETDVDGQRGILAWTFDLPAGAAQTITLDTRLTWPEGKVLH